MDFFKFEIDIERYPYTIGTHTFYFARTYKLNINHQLHLK